MSMIAQRLTDDQATEIAERVYSAALTMLRRKRCPVDVWELSQVSRVSERYVKEALRYLASQQLLIIDGPIYDMKVLRA